MARADLAQCIGWVIDKRFDGRITKRHLTA